MGHPKTRHETPEALLQRWRRRRDPEALGALFDATAPALFRVALGILGDPNQAEDALQETFLTLLENAEGHDAKRLVTPWLVGILRNHARALRRRSTRAPDPRRLRGASSGALPASATERGLDDRVRRALDDFDEPYRSVGLLHWCYGLSPAEIAHIRGEPPGTTRSTLTRIRQRLRERHPEHAALLGVGPTGQGLAALRAELLQHAGRKAASSATLVLGGLVMKKILIAVFAVLVVGLLAWLRPWASTDAPPLDGASKPPTAVAAPLPPDGAAPHLAGRPTPTVETPAPTPRGPVVRGVVVDAAGVPLADARVFVVPADHAERTPDPLPMLDPASGGARSDAQGLFLVDVPEGVTRLDLLAAAEGFAPELLRDVLVHDDVRVVLARHPKLEGRILDVEERPVPGAVVRIRGLLGTLSFERETVTSDEGTYDLDLPLGPGELLDLRGVPLGWHLAVEADGFAPLLHGSVRLGVLSRAVSGRTYTRDFVLLRGGTLAGQVTDAATGGPVAEARVVVFNRGGDLSVSFGDGRRAILDAEPRTLGIATTDDNGRFEIRGLPARDPRAGNSGGALGWAAAWKQGHAASIVSVATPDDGGRSTRDFTLRRTGRIEGRVVGRDGAPAPTCRVTAYADAPANLSLGFLEPPGTLGAPTVVTRTSTDGTFVLPHAPAGSPITVLVNPLGPLGGFTFEQRGVSLDAGGIARTPDVAIGRPAGSWVHAGIRVLDAEGRPIAGADVGTSPTVTSAWSDAEGLVRLRWARGGPAKPPEAYLVRAPGHAPALVAIEYTEGEADPVEVRLARGHVLTGKVVEADGSPAAGVRITVADGRVEAKRALPAERFDLGGLQPGQNANLDLLGKTLTQEDGSFRVGDLPEGPYHVEASAKRELWGVKPAPERARVLKVGVPDAEALVELVLPEGGTPPVGRVRGRAIDESGRSVSGVEAWLEREGQMASTDRVGPGRFAIAAAPVGVWTLRVEAKGRVPHYEKGLQVKEGNTTDVEVVLARGVAVEGKALDPEGRPLGDYEIGFSPVGSEGWRNRTVLTPVGPDGSFRTAGLVPGVWRVAAAPRGQFSSRSASAVPKGSPFLRIAKGETEVRFDGVFVAGGRLSISVGGEQWPRPLLFAASTTEQMAFGEASRIVVLDGAERTLVDHRDLYGSGYLGEASQIIVATGTYLVRLESPAGTNEQQVDVESGGRARVYFENP